MLCKMWITVQCNDLQAIFTLHFIKIVQRLITSVEVLFFFLKKYTHLSFDFSSIFLKNFTQCKVYHCLETAFLSFSRITGGFWEQRQPVASKGLPCKICFPNFSIYCSESLVNADFTNVQLTHAMDAMSLSWWMESLILPSLHFIWATVSFLLLFSRYSYTIIWWCNDEM